MAKSKRDNREAEAIDMMVELANVKRQRAECQGEWEMLDRRVKHLQTELTTLGQSIAAERAARGGGNG